jgi:hypothetical protein
MAHKLIDADVNDSLKGKSSKKTFNIEGKIGVSLFIGAKEVFLGIQINEVQKETVYRKKFIPLKKSSVRVFRFD